MQKDKLVIDDRHLVCLLHFEEDVLPKVYIIPATAWNEPNAVLVNRNCDKPGQKSKPEWGINYSKKNKGMIENILMTNFSVMYRYDVL